MILYRIMYCDKRTLFMKSSLSLIIVIAVIFTIGIFIKKPVLHKPFSINTIEYLVKINDDGSMTTTKQTTYTQFMKERK